MDEEAVDYAVQKGIIDNGSTELESGVEDSEIVVVATYVGNIPRR